MRSQTHALPFFCVLKALTGVLFLFFALDAPAADPGLPLSLGPEHVPPTRPDTRNPHLSTPLSKLSNRWSRNQAEAREFAQSHGLDVENKRVWVTLRMTDGPAAEAAIERIPGLGGTVSARFQHVFDAWVPIGQLSAISKIPGVTLVHEVIKPVALRKGANHISLSKAGAYVTEGLALSNADIWQSAGETGANITVGVLDISFKDISFAIQAGELPDSTFCYPDCTSLNTSDNVHGTACAEIVYDMAPNAEIVVTSVATTTEFRQRVAELAENGVDVISSSLGLPDQVPGDGTGPTADAIQTARSEHGTLFVNSAGNNALTHWDGGFTDGNLNNFHDFSSTDELNVLNSGNTIPAGTDITAYLRWNDWPHSDQDYDLLLYYHDGSSWNLVATSQSPQTGSQPPWEFISYTAASSGYYALAIWKSSATIHPDMDLMSFSGIPLTHSVTSRSLVEPATAPGSVSTAAVDVASLSLEPYSSRGPTHGPGGSLTGGDPQPRISGYDNVTTWSYAPNGFRGTSAAAPHVAGAAALIRGYYSNYSPGQIQNFLESRATDQGSSGYDYAVGAGRLWMGAPPPRTLNVSKEGTGSGNVTSSPAGIACGADCASEYSYNTDVSLSASPASDSTFEGWSGDGDCSDGSLSMTTNYSCTATFDLIPSYTLTITKDGTGSGTVTSEPGGINCGSNCSEDYLEGTEVTLSAEASSDSTFVGWSGGPDCGNGVINMTVDQSCTATFDLIPQYYTLDVSKDGTGSGTVSSQPGGIDCGADCNQEYLEGTKVKLTGTPDIGSELTSWGGDADCSDGLLAVNDTQSCVATFNTCSAQSDVTFSETTVNASEHASSCNHLTVGPDVDITDAAALEATAGNTVRIKTNFAIAQGGTLRVIVGQPMP